MGVKNQPGLSPISKAFAAQLRAERAAAGISQAELARRAGMGRTTVLRIEAEDRDMDTSQLWAICRVLNISVVEFATRAEARLDRPGLADSEASGG